MGDFEFTHIPPIVTQAVDEAISAEQQMGRFAGGDVFEGDRYVEVARFAVERLAENPDYLLSRGQFQRLIGLELDKRQNKQG